MDKNLPADEVFGQAISCVLAPWLAEVHKLMNYYEQLERGLLHQQACQAGPSPAGLGEQPLPDQGWLSQVCCLPMAMQAELAGLIQEVDQRRLLPAPASRYNQVARHTLVLNPLNQRAYAHLQETPN